MSAQWVTAHFPLRTFTGNWSVALEMNNSLEVENYLEKGNLVGYLDLTRGSWIAAAPCSVVRSFTRKL